MGMPDKDGEEITAKARRAIMLRFLKTVKPLRLVSGIHEDFIQYVDPILENDDVSLPEDIADEYEKKDLMKMGMKFTYASALIAASNEWATRQALTHLLA